MLPHEFVKALEEGHTVRLTHTRTLLRKCADGRIMENTPNNGVGLPFGGYPSYDWIVKNAEHAVIVESGVDDE